MLLYTISQGKMIDGVNASRWIKDSIIGISFQTSSLASLILMIYIAYYLDKVKEQKIDFRKSLFPLWTPVFFDIHINFSNKFVYGIDCSIYCFFDFNLWLLPSKIFI